MTSGLYQIYRQKAVDPNPRLKITGATNATPIVITTSAAHGLATADVVAILGVTGNTAANGTWTITVLSSTTFSLDTSVGSGTYTAATGEVLLTDTLLKKSPYIVRWGTGTSGGGNRDYGDDIKAVLVNVSGSGTLYAVDLAADEFLSSISSGARIATSSNLSSKTTSTSGPFVGGTVDAADVVFSAVGPAGTTIEAVVLYKDTGTEATSPLIAYLDSTSVTGLPVTANGSDITLTFDSGTNRIFKI